MPARLGRCFQLEAVLMRIIEEGKGYIRIEADVDIGLLNAIAEKLNTMEGIEYAAVVKEHPYMEKPKLVVRGKAVKQAIKKAIKMLKDEARELASAVE